jgi:peptidyl-prolyl cis-trans isomerase C
MRAHLVSSALLLASLSLAGACGSGARTRDGGPQGEAKVHGLTAAERREVLAHVGNKDITLGEFADRLAAQSPYLRARYNSPERRRELLDNMIRFELLAQEAERRGYTRDPEVTRAEAQSLVQTLLEREIDARIRPTDITAEQIRAYYTAHPEEFDQPEQVRASHIRTADRASAQRLLAQLLAAPTDDMLFTRLVRESSNDLATRESGGDLRFFSKPVNATRTEDAPPVEVANAAFALRNVGDLSPEVVQSPEGFHIVKLIARRQAMHRTLEEVQRPIQNRLYRERREEMQRALVERLRRQANIQEDESALAAVRIEIPAPEPEGTPRPELPR